LHRPAILSKEYLSKLITYGASIMGMQFFNMLSVPLVKVILANTIGVESVGIFELALRPAYSIRTLFEKGLFAIMPDISILSSQDKENAHLRVKERVNKITRTLVMFGIPFFLILSALAPLWLKLWLGASYSASILYGYWFLQPGIIIGLLILPYYYALLGTQNQRYCLYESILRALITILLCSLFYILDLNIYYSFAFISFSVVISNIFIVYGFRKNISQGILR
jgi:O-antigen/teichoic acid export membrane protein